MSEKSSIRTTKGSAVYPQIERSLAKLGQDISLARRTRRISAEEFCAQMGVSRTTLHRLEKGDPGISLNTLSMAMFVLGQLDRVTNLADLSGDDVGRMLTRRDAPQRVTRPRSSRSEPAPSDEPKEPGSDGSDFVGW